LETIYIEQDNCVLHQAENHLVVKKQGHTIGSIPLINVSAIVILGNIQITSHAINLIFQKNINVMYTSKSGRINGQIQPQLNGGAVLRLAQSNAFMNLEKRSKLAGSIVKGKIKNQVCLLEKYKRYYSLKSFNDVIFKLNSYSQKADVVHDLDEIMGYEGISARMYWDCFRGLVKNQVFLRRDYRPAPDYINSALNLGYTLLSNEITICLTAEKFDVEIGFLHSIHYGRASLALDIMEEFRTPFIDAWLLNLFNKRILNETHFLDEEHGFYLSKDGFRRFIALYHEHKNKWDWQKNFRLQAKKLKMAVLNNDNYEPFEW